MNYISLHNLELHWVWRDSYSPYKARTHLTVNISPLYTEPLYYYGCYARLVAKLPYRLVWKQFTEVCRLVEGQEQSWIHYLDIVWPAVKGLIQLIPYAWKILQPD